MGRYSIVLWLLIAAACGSGRTDTSNTAPDGSWHYFLAGDAAATSQCPGGFSLGINGTITFAGGVGGIGPSLNTTCNSGTCTNPDCGVVIQATCTIASSGAISCPVAGGSGVTMTGTCASTGARNNGWACTAAGTGTVSNASGSASYSNLHMTFAYPL